MFEVYFVVVLVLAKQQNGTREVVSIAQRRALTLKPGRKGCWGGGGGGLHQNAENLLAPAKSLFLRLFKRWLDIR